MTVDLRDIFGRPHWDIAARYHAARQDRIAATIAATYEPGTPDAYEHGCICDPIPDDAWELAVGRGCPMHDPRGE